MYPPRVPSPTSPRHAARDAARFASVCALHGDAPPYRLSVDIDALPPPALAAHARGLVVGAEITRLMTGAPPDTLGETTFVIGGGRDALEKVYGHVRGPLGARRTEDGVEFTVEHGGYDWPWRVMHIDDVACAARAFADLGDYVYDTLTGQVLIPSAK